MKSLNVGMTLFTMSLFAAPMTQSAFAATEPLQLELTSFRLTNPSPDRTAELCGRVLGRFSGAHRINVTVDPGQSSGTYVTFPGSDGRFCLLVNTYIGRVQAFVWDGSTRPSQPVVVETQIR